MPIYTPLRFRISPSPRNPKKTQINPPRTDGHVRPQPDASADARLRHPRRATWPGDRFAAAEARRPAGGPPLAPTGQNRRRPTPSIGRPRPTSSSPTPAPEFAAPPPPRRGPAALPRRSTPPFAALRRPARRRSSPPPPRRPLVAGRRPRPQPLSPASPAPLR